MELHPHPELLFELHPQFVAVKSLMVLPPKDFIYAIYYEQQQNLLRIKIKKLKKNKKIDTIYGQNT